MVTNYPRSIASRQTGRTVATHAEGFGGRIFDWIRQLYCGMHGHDTMLQFEQDRLCLRCVSCGHETPGWALNEAKPTVTRGETRRQPLARPQLISARRIA